MLGAKVQGGEEDRQTTTWMSIFHGLAVGQDFAGFFLLHFQNSPLR